MNKSLKNSIEFLNSSVNDMLFNLSELCLINSGSENLDGLQIVHDKLRDLFSPIACHIESVALPLITEVNMDGFAVKKKQANALLISKRPELTTRVLLTGHMDTVFAKNHPFQKLTQLDDNTINGPGVADMKGGLLVILYALMAFEKMDTQKNIGFDVFINPDEETGSLASSTIFPSLAKTSNIALIYEPSQTPDGMLTKNRKGSGKLTLVAKGRTAHAGRDFYSGRNAICYLAKIIEDIDKLNGQKDGVTINIGKIQGGEALNAVPETAVMKMDVRITHPEDENWVRTSLDKIIQKHKDEDHHVKLYGDFTRPVKRVDKKTTELFKLIQKCGKDLGLSINWQDSGGCCDGNNFAQLNVPVIDTLGVRGGKIHSSDEFLLIDSLAERASLSLLILNALNQGVFGI